MKFSNRIFCFAGLAIVLFTYGCKKINSYEPTIPASEVHFDGAADQSYEVRSAAVEPFAIEVGTTDISSTDRIVSINIISTTGAVAGTQYNIPGGNSVTIPAGKATGVIFIQGIYSGYPPGRIDTLILSLAQPSVTPSEFSDTIKLALGDICVEGVGFNLDTLLGTYSNTIETFGTNPPYGPYTTTISSVTQTGPTTGSIVVTNIWDAGWNPITFDLDWTDSDNLIASLQQQDNIADGSTIDPTYAGNTVTVTNPSATSFPGVRGTFSTCNGTLTLRMRICVLPLGCFSTSMYTVNMAR